MNIPFSKTSILLPVMVAVVVLSACDDKKNMTTAAPPAVRVTVQEVSYLHVQYNDEYPGTVTALEQVELRPQVSGFITGVHFKDGARVSKGQLLYTIDNQLYAANYQQSVATMQAQQAALDKAEKDAKRYHELDKKDAIAKQLVDNADAAVEVAKKQVAAATATMQALQTNVRYTEIRAPFDGVIGISSVKIGTAVTAGQTLLNTVSTDNELAVDFNIDQKEIYRFTTMLGAGQNTKDTIFTLAFGKDVYPFPGKIALLDRAVNPQTGTIKARLIFPNPKHLLISGMNTTVRVKGSTAAQSVLIPYKAVVEQLGEFFVYVPNASNKVSQRKVLLGKQINKDVIIREGLVEGEKVVIEGVQNLLEGAAINPTPAVPAAK
ncbi:MAG: efflux RND transporter periplasmic adaptor subunit [Candidatus Kapaibacterium sp.]